MFWWLWSTRKKVTVLLLVMAFPLALLGVRVFGAVFPDSPGVASPSTVAPSIPAPAGSSTVPDSSVPTNPEALPPTEPLLLRPQTGSAPSSALASFPWLGLGALPPPADVALSLPGAGDGLSIWGLHQGVESFRALVDSYRNRYQATGEVEVELEKVSSTVERLRFSGVVEGTAFTATIRFLDLGAGEVSVAGIADPV